MESVAKGTVASTTASAAVEEPEYLARYLVVKHSWRGRYKRILCISSGGIVTLDPNTLVVTNSYDTGSNFDGASPLIGRDENTESVGGEFTINVRTDGKGKFKAMKFSSRCRASILTELYRLRWNQIRPVAEFQVLHLRRRNAEWVPYKLKVTFVGLELVDSKSGDSHWILDFRDMDSPAIILLSDAYRTKSTDSAGFVLCPMYGRKSKAFRATPGTTNSSIFASLAKTAKSMVGVFLLVDDSKSLTASEYMTRRAKEAVGAEETPNWCWSVTRLRSAGHGTLNMPGLRLEIGPKGGLGEHGNAVSLQLILTKASLVERRIDNYEVVIVRPLSAVSSVVRFAEEPQMFAIEFSDGSPVHVYASISRDNLLAAILDTLQIEGQSPIPVLPRLSMPGHRIDPPCGRVSLISGPQHLVADMETCSLHLKHLAAAAKDAVAEGCYVPGCRARLWRRIREFNACIPYTGVPANIEVPEVTLMALITMLPSTPTLPVDAPPLPPPSPKAAATVIGFVACLRRLLSSRSAASHIMSFPAAVNRIMGLLRNGSEGVAAEAAGRIASLIGGWSADLSSAPDSRGEKHATIMHTKSVLFAQQGYVTILFNRLKPMSVSPLFSMAIVEVFEAMVCDPHGETTQYTVFVELLRQIAALRRRLFALFAHPAESVREIIAVIMRTIAEEDAIAAESMRDAALRDAALRDAALLRHLLNAFSLPASERREVSRQLVALWADSYQPALDLLSRVLPPGLVAYLHTRPDDVLDDTNQEGSSTNRRQKRLLQQRRGRITRGPGAQDFPLPPGNNAETGDSAKHMSANAGSVPDSFQRPAADSPSEASNLQASAFPGGNSTTAGVSQNGYSAFASITTNANGHEQPETNASNLVGSDSNLYGIQNSLLPAPAQVIGESTPVGSRKLLLNWREFWRAFGLDHNRADLIWNERTRQELSEALKAEVHNLDVEKERT